MCSLFELSLDLFAKVGENFAQPVRRFHRLIKAITESFLQRDGLHSQQRFDLLFKRQILELILELVFLIELGFLKGREKLKGFPVRSLIVY